MACEERRRKHKHALYLFFPHAPQPCRNEDDKRQRKADDLPPSRCVPMPSHPVVVHAVNVVEQPGPVAPRPASTDGFRRSHNVQPCRGRCVRGNASQSAGSTNKVCIMSLAVRCCCPGRPSASRYKSQQSSSTSVPRSQRGSANQHVDHQSKQRIAMSLSFDISSTRVYAEMLAIYALMHLLLACPATDPKACQAQLCEESGSHE